MSTEAHTASSSRAGVPNKSHKSWWIAIAVVVIGGGAAANWWTQGRASHPPTEAGAGSLDATASTPGAEDVRVEVVFPTAGGLTRTSSQIGSIHAFEEAQLYAKVSGYLKTQTVDIGSRVKKGDLLAEIDDPEVVKEASRDAASVAQAKAAVAQAKARVESAQADAKAAEAQVAKAEADVATFTSRRKYREKELSRYRDLRAREAVPQQVVDEYQDHFDTAVAEERAAQVAVLSAKAQLLAAEAKIDQAKADLGEAVANVGVAEETFARANVLVDYTRITSPYDGVITLRSFHVGDFIRSAVEGGADKPLLTASRTDKMRVVTYVPDRDVPYTDVGDKAVVTFDALPGQKFEGTVARFAYTEETQTRTMRTEIDLPNPKAVLREGMYGVATIILDTDTALLTIPSACLIGKSQNGKASVFVVKSGRAHEVPISVGSDNGIRVEIVHGLTESDRVILDKGVVTEDIPVIVVRPGKTEAPEPRAS